MAKAILEFNLPEEQDLFDSCHRGPQYDAMILDVYTWLRSQWKYDAGEILPDEARKVWERIYDTMREYGIESP